MIFDTQRYLESASLEWCFHWFVGQVVGVSNRGVKEVAARHHTFIWKCLIFHLSTLGVEKKKKKKFIWLFFISQIVSEMLMQGEIYAWSVIKSAYTESDGLDLKKKKPTSLIKKIFHVKMDLYPKLSSSTRGLEETGASEAAFYSPVRRARRWQLALTAVSPWVYGMKPANLAPSYCPTFSFKNHQWRRYWWSLLVESEMAVAAQRSIKLWIDLVANSSPGLGLHVSQQAYDIFHCSPFMSIPNWTAPDHFTARHQAWFQLWAQSSCCRFGL